MNLNTGNKAEHILSSVHPNLESLIKENLEHLHPSNTFDAVKIDRPSVLVAIGKNALVQSKVVLNQYNDLIENVYIHQVADYTDQTIEEYSDQIFLLPHPSPSDATFSATKKTLNDLKSLGSDIDIHLLISGGGSAAFALAEQGITVDQYAEIIRLAMAAGFDIYELNLIRSLIDKVKVGKLSQLILQHNVYAWISSDVVGDDPRIVASGPVCAGIDIDPSVTNWLERLFLSLNIDIEISTLISKLPENTPDNHTNTIVATRQQLIKGLQTSLETLDFQVVIADTNLSSSVQETATQISQLTQQFARFSRRVIIWSGEPTISLSTHAIDTGQGGRISALTCLLSEEILELEKVVFIGFATDSQDGSSPVSGYVINSSTIDELRSMGSPQELVKSGNSGLALASIGNGIVFENTDINLLDIFMVIIGD